MLSALRAAAEHLSPEGLFIFDAYCADDFHARSRPEDYPEDRMDEVARVVHRGRSLTVYENSRWDREAHRMDAFYTFIDARGRTLHRHRIGHRYVLSGELDSLFSRAGLRPVARYGSFAEDAHAEKSGSLIAIAARA